MVLKRTYNNAIMRSCLCCALLFMGFNSTVFAQQEKVKEAINYYDKQNLDSAKIAIDIAIKNEQTGKEARTWYYSGFIYKELYKKYESDNVKSPYRDHAISDFKKAIELGSDEKYVTASRSTIKVITSSYFNDAVKTMNRDNYKLSVISFEKYKDLTLLVDPSINLNEKNIEYYLALGGLFTRIHETDGSNTDRTFWEKAKDAYNYVLKIDSENMGANYNMGILYYNKAVNIINGTDFDIDLVALNDIQDTSIVLFKQSLPYMETAYKLQPDNENTLIGLSGIYFGLNQIDKSEKIRKELEDLRKNR